MIDPLIPRRFHAGHERRGFGRRRPRASNEDTRFQIGLNSSGGVMICSLRNAFLLPVVVAVGASVCLAQSGSITRIQENDASITYSGDWNRHVLAGHSGGGAMITNVMGA